MKTFNCKICNKPVIILEKGSKYDKFAKIEVICSKCLSKEYSNPDYLSMEFLNTLFRNTGDTKK